MIGRIILWQCLLLTGAAPAASISVVDDIGQTLAFTRPPQRIVSLSPHLTELLFVVGAGAQLEGVRRVYFEGQWFESTIYAREKLNPGNRVEGPSVIEEMGSTTLLHPGDRGRVDPYGNILIQIPI